MEYIKKFDDFYPKDIEESTIIHVRLGDVVCGNYFYEKWKRPINIEKIQEILQDDNNKKYIIGHCFFSEDSSNNYEECLIESNNYLIKILNLLNADYIYSENADFDLCFAVKAKKFVQGRGFYSKLIVEIRKKLNKENIETECEDFNICSPC